jgi:hypothetical protein
LANGLASSSFGTSGLAAAATYYWQVVARNDGGTTSGPVWSFSTASAPPASPLLTPADGATGVPTSVTLFWSAAGATTYDLKFGSTTPPAAVLTGTGATSYTPQALTQGSTYYWQVIARNSGGMTASPIVSFTTATAGSSPFTGTPFALPGTIEAEQFDNGGQGVAYNDVTAGNTGTAYRQTDVDLEPASENGYDVGWISAGEWLKYTVNVVSAGSYLFEARVASLGQGGTFHVEAGGVNVTGPLTIPDTGGWQRWVTVSKTITVPAGNQVLRVVFDASGVNAVGNLNWIRVSPLVVATLSAPTSPSPADGAANVSATVTTLAWSAAGATSYDVNFGTANPPPAAGNGLTTPSFAVSLSGGTTYYWRVTARSATGATTGPVWSFTTATGGGGTSGTVWNVPAGGNLQAAINNAQPGDTILLEAGATFTGNFILPAKSGSSFITIRSAAADSLLPGPNRRIDPSYAPLLPKIKSPNTMSALATAPGAHHYRLMFLEFPSTYQGYSIILRLGDGSSVQNALSQVPYELVLDRIYVHGDPVYGQKCGITVNSASTTIMNSYVAGIRAVGQDSQAIAGTNGPGPFTIVNNYLEAAGENILFGGADPHIPNLVPSDIVVRGNHLYKPLSWRTETQWTVKNLFELKNAQRVVVDGNVMENNWLAAQVGYAVLFTPRNQDGTCPWCVVRDVQFTNNVVRHTGSAVKILGEDYNFPSLEASDITIRNNLFEDVSGVKYGGQGRLVQMTDGGRNITFDHNTVLQDGLTSIYVGHPVENFVFTSNIIPDYSWAIKGDGWSAGNPTITNLLPNSTILGNIFAGSNPAIYPTGNHYPASMDAVGFVNYVPLTGGNYRLALTSLYRNAGNDGKDVGVDIDALNAAAGTSY